MSERAKELARDRALFHGDLYARWENSECLREAVRDDLYEWGSAQRGALPDLGYPHRNTLDVSPDSRRTPTYDPKKVDEMDRTFRWWSELICALADEDGKRQQNRMMAALRSHFISERPAEASAERLGVSRATFYRMLGDAMRRFWMLHDVAGLIYHKTAVAPSRETATKNASAAG